jgi:hypothetical protein
LFHMAEECFYPGGFMHIMLAGLLRILRTFVPEDCDAKIV